MKNIKIKNTQFNLRKPVDNLFYSCYNKKHIKSVYTLKGSYTADCKIWYTLLENSTHKGVLRRLLYEFFYSQKCEKERSNHYVKKEFEQ